MVVFSGNPSPSDNGAFLEITWELIFSLSWVFVFFCSINETKLLALWNSLRDSFRSGFHNMAVESDSYCAIRWSSGSANPRWCLAEICNEVVELTSKNNVSFSLVKRSAKEATDGLDKGVLESPNLLVETSSWLLGFGLGDFAFSFLFFVSFFFFLSMSLMLFDI